MLSRLRSAGISKRAFFFLTPPSRRGEKGLGGVFGLIRLGPVDVRTSISCWLRAIQSELLWGDMGRSGCADGKTELGLTLTGKAWLPNADGMCGMKDDCEASKSPVENGSNLDTVGVREPELSGHVGC